MEGGRWGSGVKRKGSEEEEGQRGRSGEENVGSGGTSASGSVGEAGTVTLEGLYILLKLKKHEKCIYVTRDLITRQREHNSWKQQAIQFRQLGVYNLFVLKKRKKKGMTDTGWERRVREEGWVACVTDGN